MPAWIAKSKGVWPSVSFGSIWAPFSSRYFIIERLVSKNISLTHLHLQSLSNRWFTKCWRNSVDLGAILEVFLAAQKKTVQISRILRRLQRLFGCQITSKFRQFAGRVGGRYIKVFFYFFQPFLWGHEPRNPISESWAKLVKLFVIFFQDLTSLPPFSAGI